MFQAFHLRHLYTRLRAKVRGSLTINNEMAASYVKLNMVADIFDLTCNFRFCNFQLGMMS